jgi:hypothetical protein
MSTISCRVKPGISSELAVEGALRIRVVVRPGKSGSCDVWRTAADPWVSGDSVGRMAASAACRTRPLTRSSALYPVILP